MELYDKDPEGFYSLQEREGQLHPTTAEGRFLGVEYLGGNDMGEYLFEEDQEMNINS